MEIYPLFLDDIRVPDNHRALNEEAVAGLVSSFKEIGQQIPITYYDDEDGAVLIAGLHRLEAARRLDWDTARRKRHTKKSWAHSGGMGHSSPRIG